MTSPRSQRVRQEARQRPDKIWFEQDIIRTIKYDSSAPSRQPIISTNNKLADSIARADDIQASMRKIVK